MNETKVQWDISRLKEFAKDPESFINEMDKLLTAGELSTFTRSEIKYVLSQIVPNKSYDYLEERVRLGTYLFLISPDYAVIR